MRSCTASRRYGYGQLRHLFGDVFLSSSRFHINREGRHGMLLDLLTVGGIGSVIS